MNPTYSSQFLICRSAAIWLVLLSSGTCFKANRALATGEEKDKDKSTKVSFIEQFEQDIHRVPPQLLVSYFVAKRKPNAEAKVKESTEANEVEKQEKEKEKDQKAFATDDFFDTDTWLFLDIYASEGRSDYKKYLETSDNSEYETDPLWVGLGEVLLLVPMLAPRSHPARDSLNRYYQEKLQEYQVRGLTDIVHSQLLFEKLIKITRGIFLFLKQQTSIEKFSVAFEKIKPLIENGLVPRGHGIDQINILLDAFQGLHENGALFTQKEIVDGGYQKYLIVLQKINLYLEDVSKNINYP